MAQKSPIADKYPAALCLDEIASVSANVCNYTINVPSFCFMVLQGYS